MSIGASDLVSVISVLSGVGISLLYARKAKKAEVEAKEVRNESDHIDNAKEMVTLVKTAFTEVSALKDGSIEELRSELILLRGERGKDRKAMQRLARALESIDRCDHRHQCPVIDELQERQVSGGGKRSSSKRANSRDHPGHNDCDPTGSVDDPGVT